VRRNSGEKGEEESTVFETDVRPLPALDNMAGALKALAVIIEDIHAGRIDPKIAAGVAPLMNSLIRGLEPEETERRLKKWKLNLRHLRQNWALEEGKPDHNRLL
jgi:hypothetical protein